MLPHLLAHAVYIHNFIYSAFPGAVNTVAWSLEVEVQFYILVPILSLVFAIANHRVRRLVILSSIGVVGLVLPVVMLFSGAFFLLIERPCMDREWPKKLWRQAQTLLPSRAEQPQS